jgi:hypothetical protein
MRQARSRLTALALAACAGILALALAEAAPAQGKRELPPLAPAPADGLTSALEAGRLSEAEYALERARSLFQPAQARGRFGAVARPGLRDATAILRDLVLRKDELTGLDHTLAGALLARPDDGHPVLGNGWHPEPENHEWKCSDTLGVAVCVHWVGDADHPDAPDPTDVEPANGIPDFVDAVLETLDEVWIAQIGSIGYREPKSDETSANNGVGPELDVYLDDLDGIAFGYCTSDDPSTGYDLSAYCVLDNDYASFGPLDWRDYLRVTAAHEFFHAVQYAYDAWEDLWLLEGTATNMETTIYPEIRDNVFFLDYSPLTRPGSPLDRSGFFDSEYGSWIFFRFLEEKVAGGDPAIIREIWERADASDAAAFGDMYSIQAVRRTLASRGLAFPDAFARFARANRLRDYADGALYPAPPFTRKWSLGRQRTDTRWQSWRINHLASRHYSFRPASAARNGKLEIRVRLPRGDSRATVIVVRPGGRKATRYLTRNASGVARTTVRRFSRGQAQRVHVVLTNGSTRYRCWRDTGVAPPFYSCLGRPRDDRLRFELRARFSR